MNSWIIKFENEVIDCFDTEQEAKQSLSSDKVIDSFGYDVTKSCEIIEVKLTQHVCNICRLFREDCCPGFEEIKL